jgi:NADH:ubiquinone reductase (non-electrogenic)
MRKTPLPRAEAEGFPRDGPPSRIVVLGSGFGGFSFLSHFPRGLAELTLVSPRNYFLFTPLLPSAVSGTVEFRSILEPTRRKLGHVRILDAFADRVEFQEKRIACRGAVGLESFTLEYDVLVVAVGAQVADYGVPGVKEHTHPLTTIEDGRAIRRGILEQLAVAEVPGIPEDEVRRRLTFVICGAGPTGVEVAAEIQELLKHELRRSYPRLAPLARIVLIEAQERILTSFAEALSDYAKRTFRRDGIEVRTGAEVASIEKGVVHLANGEAIRCGFVIWAAGNAPTEFTKSLGFEMTSGGRIKVGMDLRVPGRDDVYALGDCAAAGEPPMPATAQIAQQQGKYLAKALANRLRGKPVRPFRRRDFGMLAYLGAGRALADLPQAKWAGWTAWLFWRSVYVTKLVSFSNKVKVLFDWTKARMFGRDLSRF